MKWNRQRTIDAINGAFDRASLQTALIDRLNVKLDDLVTITKKFPDQLSEMVQSLIERGLFIEALDAFCQARPQNGQFQSEMKLTIAALQQAKADGKTPEEAEENTGSYAEKAFRGFTTFFGTQKKFFAGAILTILLLASVLFLIPSDEVAIRTLNEAGDPIGFVSLFYYPKITSSNTAHDPNQLELKAR